MQVGILLPGFSAGEDDPAIPVQHDLVRELARHEPVRVLALRYPHHRGPYSVFGAGVTPLGYTNDTRGLRRLLLWADAIQALQRLHREQPFDVLHAMWADESGLIAAWAGRLLGVPVVVSVIGGELARVPGYGLQHRAFSRWIVRRALSGADAVVSACSYVDGLLAGVGYATAAPQRVVLGVDAARFTPGDGSRRPRHLFNAASMIAVKDQATLLRALARLPGDVTLSIAGDGPDRPALESLAGDLGVTGRVTFLGIVEHGAMVNHYRGAALHVLTSRHEGLGMVTLEAAACGLPTVGTAVGLLPDDADLGVAVAVGDDAALAGAIRSLLDDPSRLDALRRSARAAVEARYTIRRAVERLRVVYRSVGV